MILSIGIKLIVRRRGESKYAPYFDLLAFLLCAYVILDLISPLFFGRR
jgi:hypothetical protein